MIRRFCWRVRYESESAVHGATCVWMMETAQACRRRNSCMPVAPPHAAYRTRAASGDFNGHLPLRLLLGRTVACLNRSSGLLPGQVSLS